MSEFVYRGNPTETWRQPAPAFVIGEIGKNHNGDLEIAKRLIDSAKSAGFDAVTFQKRTINIVYPPELLASPCESMWGATQRAQKEGLEFGKDEYDEIDRYCQEAGVCWFASAWDIPSQQFLRQYNLRYNKVASAMVTHHQLRDVIAEEGKITFIVTGMCTIVEIDTIVDCFVKKGCPFVLMHAVSETPAADEILNLRCIQTLQKRYNCPVGYSGHELGVMPSTIAAAMGACTIERHITLDRKLYGSDQAASLEPADMVEQVSQLRKIPYIVGDGVKRITLGEHAAARKLRNW